VAVSGGAFAHSPRAAAQAAPESSRPTTYYVGHGGAIVGLGGVALLTHALLRPDQGGDFSWFPGDVSVRGNRALSAARVSDALVATTLIAPVAENLALGADVRLANAGIVYGEALALNLALNSLTKVVVSRRRPYTYWAGAAASSWSQNRADWYVSFYSGHSSTTFTAAFAGSYLFGEASSDPALRSLVWGSELMLAALTANLRVRAGRHYYSDIFTGALVGTAVGLGVPLLHGGKYRPGAPEVLSASAGVIAGTALGMLLPFTHDEVSQSSWGRLLYGMAPMFSPGAAGIQLRGTY